MKKRSFYGICFMLLLVIEVLIALYIDDSFIRPYLGDVLVVVLLYFLIKWIRPSSTKWLPLYIFLFAAGVELLQYFGLIELLNLQDHRFFRIVLGSVFDIKDIICYGTGCGLIALITWIQTLRQSRN